nr:hypothetical protein [Tanacetum cinerariifolium]
MMTASQDLNFLPSFCVDVVELKRKEDRILCALCFDNSCELDIDQNENNILGPSAMAIAKKLKAIIQKDALTIADLEGARLERLKQQYQNDVELKYYVDQLKAAVLSEVKWNSDENDDMYWLQLQDKLHHLPLEFMKDFKNELLLFIKRVVIQNMVEDIQLGVESYQQTLNLTKPMRLSKVKKFCDGTLVKIRGNQINMVTKNKSGKGNRRLKGIDWTDNDVVKSHEVVRKIDQTLKCREQLRRLEEYVGGRPKTVNPRTFVRPV